MMPSPAYSEGKDSAPAQNISSRCDLTCSQGSFSPYKLTDDTILSSTIFCEGTIISYRWDDDVPAAACYFFFITCPEACVLTQKDADGQVLSQRKFAPVRRCELMPLEPDCREVSLLLSTRCKLAAFQIYDGTTPPPELIVWRDPPATEHTDLMLITAHCDDEILMMGGVLPIYAGQEGRDCVVAYIKGDDVRRQIESILGLWEMGVKREPVFWAHTNGSLEKSLEGTPSGKDALRDIVTAIRTFRPDVIVTQDENGEYGHEAHIMTVALVKKAVEAAADPMQYPDSAEAYGTWQAKKLYLHLYAGDALELDVDTPLSQMGGRSAFSVAEDAFAHHTSQQENWSVRKTHTQYPIGNFGLFYTAVGEDTLHTDMFEHITEEGTTAPTAEPTAEPTLTPASVTPEPAKTPAPSTAAPTAEPTAEPTLTPASVTPEPAKAPAPSTAASTASVENTKEETGALYLILTAIAEGLLILSVIVLLLRRRKQRKG